MSIHARAPVRIDFAGGWTDVDTFAQESGGVVVNAAITLYAQADFLLGGNRIRLCAEDLHEHVSLSSPAQLVYDGRLDLHKAALNMLPVTGGIEILTRSDAPAGSGLGASGALDVTLVAGLLRCRRETYDREELAELGYQLETLELGLLGGRQDQYAAALGGFHELVFDRNTVESRRLPIDEGEARDLQQHLVLVYTGQSHFSSQTHERVWDAWSREDSGVRQALMAIRDLGKDAAAAIGKNDWRRLADIVGENWRQQQRLDATISTPQVESIEDAARAAGAWGVKATGAGAGGCLLIVCPPRRREAVADATVSAGGTVLEFSFDFHGVAVSETDDAPGDR
jgi:D-glycero-alpha-D-manno-heptose-7-phosphate kinase